MKSAPTLKNYIRSARLRSGFSQEELAFLLGGRGGKTVSRYEIFQRDPMLRMAIGLEVTLGMSVRELFPRAYAEAIELAQRRARVLSAQLRLKPDTKANQLKQRSIEAILRGESIVCAPHISK